MTSVGFLGLGAMGSRMAAKLLEAGHDVIVWNRSPEKAQDLVKQGARAAQTPADAAEQADAVCVMVSDPDALQRVIAGPDGVREGIAPGKTVIQMSTVSERATTNAQQAMPEGVGFLDAPVLGSLSEVKRGSLEIFVGGDDAEVRRWTPLFADLGEPIHVGPVGSGTAAKLVANSTLFGTLGVLGEAIALADGLGLSREVTAEVLQYTPLGAQAERRMPALDSDYFPVRFSLRLGLKDIDLITRAAETAGVDVRLLPAARSWVADALTTGDPERDYSTVLKQIVREDGGRAEESE